MKTIKKLLILLLLYNSTINTVLAQVSATNQMELYNNSTRSQWLNQYTDVFVSSPNSSTNLQNVHDDSNQLQFANSDQYFYFNENTNTYISLDYEETNVPIMMQPGRGYVLQIGGNGNHAQVVQNAIPQNFAGGSGNTGTITVPVVNGNFALLGNPYNGFLNLDAFLLDTNNKTKVKGPVYLWSHNTVASSNNSNPDDNSPLRFSANDMPYIMYLVA